MNASAAAISVQDLCFAYDPSGPNVLQGISTDIRPRAVTAILGPNGSGKTTLLRLLLGLIKPQSGEIRLDGRAHGTLTRRELSRLMGLVPQNEHIVFDLSVLEYVLLGRAPHLGLLELPSASDLRIALEALSLLGLETLRSRPMPSLSGGEKQLAVVARALTQQPEIFLLDEPTAHLDLANRRRILQVMDRLAEADKAVVFTTHDPNSAAAVADCVVLLCGGRILADGVAEAVLTEENLTATYGVEVQVTEYQGRPLVVCR